LGQLTKRLVERAMEVELTDHLGYEPHRSRRVVLRRPPPPRHAAARHHRHRLGSQAGGDLLRGRKPASRA
jgi:hypothetical protein